MRIRSIIWKALANSGSVYPPSTLMPLGLSFPLHSLVTLATVRLLPVPHGSCFSLHIFAPHTSHHVRITSIAMGAAFCSKIGLPSYSLPRSHLFFLAKNQYIYCLIVASFPAINFKLHESRGHGWFVSMIYLSPNSMSNI